MRRWLVLACVAGCGDNLRATPPADAPPGATSGDVTVTTMVRCCAPPGTLEAGIVLDVVQPDGTLGDHQISGLGPTVLHGVQAGASITATYPQRDASFGSFDVDVTTFLAVRPGDHLTFGDAYNNQPSGPDLPAVATFTAPQIVGAVNYFAATPCGPGFTTLAAGQVTFSITLQASCAAATAPVAVVAEDSQFQIFASGFLPDAPFLGGAPVSLPAWTANQIGGFTISVSGITGDTSALSLDATAMYPGGVGMAVFSSIPDPTAGMARLSMPATAQTYIGHAALSRPSFGVVDSYRAVPARATAALLARPIVPWIAVDGVAYNGGLGKARWLMTAGDYDAAVFALHWSRTDADNNFLRFTWTLIVPPGVTELDLGSPPPSLVPDLSPDDFASPTLQLIDIAGIVGYDELRELPEWLITQTEAAAKLGDLAGADVAN